VSFMPPDQPPPEAPPNGGPPEAAPQPPEQINEVVDECLRAIGTYARNASTSQVPADAKDFAAAAFYFAQSLDKLLPQKPSPDTQAKVQSDAVRVGATLAADEAKQAREHAHQMALEQVKAAAAKGGNKG
jgi:hypothetical protein